MKAKQPSMINIEGPQRLTIIEAKKAILEILKASNDITAEHALRALVSLSEAPKNLNISNCQFTAKP